MTEELGSSISQSQLTLSLFMLGVACGQIIFGPLSDQFGRLPVIRVGTLTYIAFSLLSSLAWNIEYMWLARIAQGAAAASGAVIARALIRDRFEGDRAAQMMALTGAAMASVPLIAPTLGAYITVEFGWRFTFVAQSVFAVLVYLGLSSLQSQSSGPRSDSKGKLTLRDIAISFRDCLGNPKFLGYQIAGTLSFCGLFIYLSTVSFFLKDVFQVPTEYFGLAFAMTVIGFVIGSLLSSRLVMKWGQDKTLHRGTFVCLGANALVLFLTLYLPSSTVGFAILSILFFFGIGLISANASMGAVSLYPKSRCCLRRLWLRAFAKLRNGWSYCRPLVRGKTPRAGGAHAPLLSGRALGKCPHPPIPSPYGLIRKIKPTRVFDRPRRIVKLLAYSFMGAMPCTKSRRTWKYCSKLSFATASSACAWILPKSTPP